MREQRLSRGWTSQYLARRAGVSQACISSIETGTRRSPSLATAERICRAFGVPLWTAIEEVHKRKKTASLS